MTMEHPALEDVFPINIGIFQCHLSVQGCHGMSWWNFLSLNFFWSAEMLLCSEGLKWFVMVYQHWGCSPVSAKFIYIWTADRYDGSSHLQNFSPKQRSTKLQHAFSVASFLHIQICPGPLFQ